MPRRPREKSESGIYHVIFRGTNKQEIFHDEEDNLRFIETIEKYKKTSNLKVHGWCLMGNHVHLLIGQGKEELSVKCVFQPVVFYRFLLYLWYNNFRRYKGVMFSWINMSRS